MWHPAQAPAAPDQPGELEARDIPSLEPDRTYEELQIDGADLENECAGGVRFRSSTS